MRAFWVMLVLGTALVAFSPARVAAAPEAHADDKKAEAEGAHKDEGDHGHKGGEKNPFAPALDLTLWTSVVFILLFLLLRAFAWKPILEGLHKREQVIHDHQHHAKQDREEAGRLREQLQLELSRASEQVRAMLDEARRDAQHMHDEMLARARSEIQAEKVRLQRELEIEAAARMQDMVNQTAQLATLVSARVVGRDLGHEDHRRLVADSLGELRAALAKRQA
jgi:F-type H+-transporting ATPase subunit b